MIEEEHSEDEKKKGKAKSGDKQIEEKTEGKWGAKAKGSEGEIERERETNLGETPILKK